MASGYACRRAFGRLSAVLQRGTPEVSFWSSVSKPTSSVATSFGRSAAARFSTSTARSSPGLFEFRVTLVHPGSFQSYNDACVSHTETRTRVEPGFLGSFKTTIGGDVNEIVEVIHHSDYDARDDTLEIMRTDPGYRAFTEQTHKMLQTQTSEMFLPATKVLQVAGGEPDAETRWRRMFSDDKNKKPGAFELRTYQLELGYNPIPKLVDLMAAGLPSKLKSDTERKGTLVGMFFSDVGRLNQFIEIWRYDTNADHIRVRESARTANKWRSTIGEIAPMVQMFDTKLTVPTAFSPVQ